VKTLAGRYEIGEAIGKGGMGVVHRARDRELARDVAVKLLAEDEPGLAERFVVEARRTAGLRHPSIVEVFDVGQDGSELFLVMELLVGETLGQRLERETRIAPDEAVRIATHVCDALAAAHDAGIVHRDLKPANVFLVTPERVKLLDFGIAKRIDGATARTDPSMLVGTIEYMAPEQIKGVAIDGRVDVYALGLTLYRAISGRPAFDGENVATLIHKQISVTPEMMGIGPLALQYAVAKMLEKDPKKRPANAREAKSALVAALATPDAQARHEGSMRVVNLDLEASEAPIELAGGHAPAGGIAAAPPPLPPPPPPPAPIRAPLPSWAAPLARVPESVAKRVVGYSLFGLVVWVVFFGGAWPLVVAFGIVAMIGGAMLWARRAST
jgi:serine/threonine-protein kinase